MVFRFLVLSTIFLVISRAAESEADVQFEFEAGQAGGVWGRYVFRDLETAHGDWMKVHGRQKSFVVSGLATGREAHLRAVIYVPGCAIQTYDTSLEHPGHYFVAVHCQPIPKVPLTGVFPPQSFRYDHPVRVEAKFIASWAAAFFQVNDILGTQIPIGSAELLIQSGSFHMLVPDFKSLPNRSELPTNEGSIRFLVRDQVTGRIVDGLRVIAATSSQKSPFGDLPNSLLQPEGIQMTFQSANQVCGHDSYGFTRRLLPEGVCDAFPPAN